MYNYVVNRKTQGKLTDSDPYHKGLTFKLTFKLTYEFHSFSNCSHVCAVDS